MKEEISKILVSQKNTEVTLAKMEVDMRHHIKRTDLLETKVQKVWMLVLLGAGAGITELGPKFIGLLKGLL